MVQLFQHRALWANRQNPAIYRTFAALLGCRELWVSIDRANMKPPARADRPGWGDQGFLHWDIDPRQSAVDPPPVQGVVALTETPADQGGFQCAPAVYRILDDWLADKDPRSDRLGPDGNPKGPDLRGVEPEPVAMAAGDLLIWDSRLPHGNSPNHGVRPRLAQYIRMFPVGGDGDRHDRVRDFEDRQVPAAFFPAGTMPPEPGPKPRLTKLGRLLLGIDAWETRR
jgi:ectoine hydroxylase-related dioxygenase (phytanoyl-CoA dioxygenase family)